MGIKRLAPTMTHFDKVAKTRGIIIDDLLHDPIIDRNNGRANRRQEVDPIMTEQTHPIIGDLPINLGVFAPELRNAKITLEGRAEIGTSCFVGNIRTWQHIWLGNQHRAIRRPIGGPTDQRLASRTNAADLPPLQAINRARATKQVNRGLLAQFAEHIIGCLADIAGRAAHAHWAGRSH